MALRVSQRPGRVSVVIPTFNATRWLGECLRSALAAPAVAEVIVVDDGSADDPQSVIDALPPEERDAVHLVRQPQRGAPAARQRGQDLATGEWLLFLDADDTLVPAALERLLAHAGADGAIYGDVEWMDVSGTRLRSQDQAPPVSHPIAAVFFGAPLTGSLIGRRRDWPAEWSSSHKAVDEFFYFAQAAVRGVRFRHVSGVVCRKRVHDSPDRLTNQGFDYVAALGRAFLELDDEVARRQPHDGTLAGYLRWIFLDLGSRARDAALRAELLARPRRRRGWPLRQGAFVWRWYGARGLVRMVLAPLRMRR
jgi:glycosyltransferase involved in cell wall biosynthesis